MLQVLIYDEKTEQFDTVKIKPDDRDVQVVCFKGVHEFAPGAESCSCGKFERYGIKR